jgi:hypothetical protein
MNQKLARTNGPKWSIVGGSCNSTYLTRGAMRPSSLLNVISDIAKACGTNAVGVRSALDEDLNGFDYFQADRWSGSSFSGRYMQSWCSCLFEARSKRRSLIETLRWDRRHIATHGRVEVRNDRPLHSNRFSLRHHLSK